MYKIGILFIATMLAIGSCASRNTGLVIPPNISAFSNDMTKHGWKLVEDAPQVQPIEVAKLEPISYTSSAFENDRSLAWEDGYSCKNMQQYAKKIGANLGQKQAEYLLAHQESIPRNFRKNYFIFPGTVWQGNKPGWQFVPALVWESNKWALEFAMLLDNCGAGGRLLVVRP